LSDRHDRGITVTENAPTDQPIAAPAHTTAAFVGRALRGPLNTPVLIRNIAEFRRRFGGSWTGSSLADPVEQFFGHGGRQAYVIRVANNARGAMICLPASHGVLTLRAVDVGSAEHIRASVDYDGIDDESLFNLTLQRVAPDTGLVLDQEIFRRLTCEKDADRNVADVLVDSGLVRAQSPLPVARPVATRADYVDPVQYGTDGVALSDYDLVGSAGKSTGLFALNQVEHFDLLYLPPLRPDRLPGPAAVLAAELYCRKRGAMLILDPDAGWRSTYDAIRGTREASYANPDVISYFPRAVRRDEEDGPAIPIGGAIAGLLCKLDRTRGPWEELDQRGYAFSRNLKPAIDIFSSDAHLLVKEGLNVIAGQNPGHMMLCGSVTLAHGTQVGDEFADLRTRRLCLAITNAIDRGTRTAMFEQDSSAARERIVSKVHAFMCALSNAGAFKDDYFLVQCDAGSRQRPVDPDRGLTILLAFHPVGSDETISLTIHQSATGCRVSKTAFAPVRADVA
jgi:phage tail sheath protein FI